MYGQTGDGRYFNFTSVIPSPPNPSVCTRVCLYVL